MIYYITTNGIGNAWVAAELEIMDRKGVPYTLHSLRAPHQNFFSSEWSSELNRKTHLIYPLPPLGLILSVMAAPFLFGPRFLAVLWNAFTGKRESNRARAAGIAHAFVACHWARGLRGQDVSLIHAQWIQSSGTVGMYGAWLLGAPFSFTGHAADLFRERAALEDKVRRADFIVCISSFHRDFYKKHGALESQLHTVYCGIDPDHFEVQRRRRGDAPPRILSVGRLVEKKGFEVLIDACKVLHDRGMAFECVIAGDGPLETSLRERIARSGLDSCVSVTGAALLQDDLPGFLATGDVFAQPCVWARDNDVDGTPRTLMEAMSCGVPSISTNLVGIPDVIEDGRSGLLVEPGDAAQLADAIEKVVRNPALADRLAEGGRARVEQVFRIDDCLEPLAELFRARLKAPNFVEGPPAGMTRRREAGSARGTHNLK